VVDEEACVGNPCAAASASLPTGNGSIEILRLGLITATSKISAEGDIIAQFAVFEQSTDPAAVAS
jgi:hypothetical protein